MKYVAASLVFLSSNVFASEKTQVTFVNKSGKSMVVYYKNSHEHKKHYNLGTYVREETLSIKTPSIAHPQTFTFDLPETQKQMNLCFSETPEHAIVLRPAIVALQNGKLIGQLYKSKSSSSSSSSTQDSN